MGTGHILPAEKFSEMSLATKSTATLFGNRAVLEIVDIW